jgi:hypothetical protein
MSETAPELQPTAEEVLQIEPTIKEPPVTVAVDGPVRTQDLPRKGGTTFTRTVGTTVGQTPLLRADHRRASARLISVGQAMLVAFNAASAQDASRMALVPANTILVITATTDIWVISATATTAISVITELWATGDDGGE